jgi:hypothetical protein
VIAEIAAANAAFQVIKSAIKNSGEIASAGKAVIDYFSATSKIEEEVKKTPARKRSDLEEFLALEQLRKQEQELKELLIYSGRPGLWDDFQAFRVKARQQPRSRGTRGTAETTRREGPQEETLRKHYADPLDDRPSGHDSWYCGACPLSIFGDQMIQALIGPVASLLDKFIPDATEKQRLAAEIATMAERHGHEIALAQIDVNKEEAKQDIFRGGWRPFIGWTCGTAFAYHFVLQPLLIFVMTYLGHPIPDLPEFDMASLMTVLMGMLGLGGLRTFEKARGIK